MSRQVVLAVLLFSALAAMVSAQHSHGMRQPGGGGLVASGETSANTCGNAQCQKVAGNTGTYVSRSLTYDTNTGKFSGSITTNQVG